MRKKGRFQCKDCKAWRLLDKRSTAPRCRQCAWKRTALARLGNSGRRRIRCLGCKGRFETWRSVPRKFCSRGCYFSWKRQGNDPRKTGEMVACAVCGTERYLRRYELRSPRKLGAFTCSQPCLGELRRRMAPMSIEVAGETLSKREYDHLFARPDHPLARPRDRARGNARRKSKRSLRSPRKEEGKR